MARASIKQTVNSGARQFAVDQGHRQLKHLALQIRRAKKSCSADAVHEVRVAIRRFARALAVCRPYILGAGIRKNRRRLKKIMSGAGEVRNCDVAVKLLGRFRGSHAVDLRSKLQGRRKQFARLLIAELRKWTGRRMSFKWRAALNSPLPPGKNADAEQSSHEMARQALTRGTKDFLKQGNEAAAPDASVEDLHNFRLVAKKFRYALELFRPLSGSSIDPLVLSIKRANALLGEINDCVTVAGILAEYKGGHRLADRLKKRQNKKTVEFRECWKQFGEGEQLQNWTAHLKSAEPESPKKPAASAVTQHPNRKIA